MRNPQGNREKCYTCFRPKSSCMCQYIHAIDTSIEFIILMHPKEHQKIKNTTGYLTHLSLKNSTLIKGVDFSQDTRVNSLIESKNCYLLYPDDNALDVASIDKNSEKIDVIFILDSTWILSKKMLKLSHNLASLKRISFNTTKTSGYKIKEQPASYCLSTIESTCELLKALHVKGVEEVELDSFLEPFEKMVEYQVNCLEECNPRY